MARDGHRCQYCGAHADSIDHVVPRSRGGLHEWDNVVAACRACNVRKRDRLLKDSGMRLKRPPTVAPRRGLVDPRRRHRARRLAHLPGRAPPVARPRRRRVTGGGPPWAVHARRARLPRSTPAPSMPPSSARCTCCDVDRPALVLGSTQPDGVVDVAACDAAGVEVVRRRSGGGAVLLEPGDVVWIDVELPAGRPVLGRRRRRRRPGGSGSGGPRPSPTVGVTDPVGAPRRPMVTTPWSRLVCFAGLGPGEVTDGGGPKVLGVAQRRTRAGARFQCAVPLRWEPRRLLDLLVLAGGCRRRRARRGAGGRGPTGDGGGTGGGRRASSNSSDRTAVRTTSIDVP